MQISDLCSSCSRQNFCGNGITNHYCTGYAPITYQYHTDIIIPPFDADVELDKLDNESMTEQEWLQTCNTEQLAGFIADVCYELVDDIWSNCEDTSCNYRQTEKDYWVRWLKQPHTTKE